MLTVRAATVTDADGIAHVGVAAWREAYRGLIPDDALRTLSAADRARRWTANFTQGTSATLVADDNGMLVGFVSFGTSRDDDASADIAELYSIYLLPARWRAGIGTLLHDAALQQLAGRFGAATLWVLRGNDRAMSFYQRHEWAPDGQTKTELRPGGMQLDEVRLRRQVTTATRNG